MKERHHIQKCIVSHPEILGEELLIIQEEFDQFENTDERFDLLALDKSGNLVVIENKWDDSGKDVTWQAIKYASYCSTLTRQNVIDIFNQYLQKHNFPETADETLLEFLSDNDVESSQVYPSEKQRIMLVSHSFRPEVLSAAQWLLNNKVDISCIQIKLYKYSEDFLLLDADTILPQAAIKDYTLKIANKMDDIQTQREANTQREKGT